MFAREIVNPQQERGLIALIELCRPEIHSYDLDNPRRSVTFGWLYDFDTATLVPEAEMPASLEPLCNAAADFAGIDRGEIVNCLLNRYDPGSVIQPHIDKPVWDYVIGVSLGSSVTMRFGAQCERNARFGVELAPRSIYVMTGEARHAFTHSIPAVEHTRYSITFRTFSGEGRALAESIAARS